MKGFADFFKKFTGQDTDAQTKNQTGQGETGLKKIPSFVDITTRTEGVANAHDDVTNPAMVGLGIRSEGEQKSLSRTSSQRSLQSSGGESGNSDPQLKRSGSLKKIASFGNLAKFTKRSTATPEEPSPGKRITQIVNRQRGTNVESVFYAVDQEASIPEFAASIRTLKRHPNEDRYCVISSLKQYLHPIETGKVARLPLNESTALGKTRLYAVIDGHGGSRCCDFVVDALPRKVLENWSITGALEPLEEERQPNDSTKNQRGVAESASSGTPPEVGTSSLNLVVEQMCHTLERAIVQIEREYFDISARWNDTSGACLTAALYYEGWLVVCNVGDCAACLLDHRGRYMKLSQRHHHKEKGELQRIHQAGGVVVNGYILDRIQPSRSIGDCDVKLAREGVVICDPDTYYVQLKRLPEGDGPFLVMGTDGVWDIGKRKTVSFISQHVKFWRKCRAEGTLDTKYFQQGFVDPAQALCDYARRCRSRDDITTVVAQFS